MSNTELNSRVEQDAWCDATEHAKEAVVSAGAVACHLGSAVGTLASQAVSDLGKEADELTASAGVGVQVLGGRLSDCCPQSGVLGTASQALAQKVKEGGMYLEDAKLTGISKDVAHVIRRNPISAILIAVGLGWCVGRKMKG